MPSGGGIAVSLRERRYVASHSEFIIIKVLTTLALGCWKTMNQATF